MVVDLAGTAKLLMILLPKLGDIIFTIFCQNIYSPAQIQVGRRIVTSLNVGRA